MSPVMQAIQAARLRELAGFMIWPAEEIARTLALIGADPMKLQAAIHIMTAEPGAEPVALPRSWGKSEQAVWAALPRSIQQRIADRERSRDREVRMSQDEAARARQEVTRLQALLQPAADEQQQPTKKEPENDKEERTTRRSEIVGPQVQPLEAFSG
jgi:hypothetical protein